MSELHDWEADPRPYDACLKDWRARHGWTWQQAADALREPLSTVQLHAKGRYPADTQQRRRLMTLTDLVRALEAAMLGCGAAGWITKAPARRS